MHKKCSTEKSKMVNLRTLIYSDAFHEHSQIFARRDAMRSLHEYSQKKQKTTVRDSFFYTAVRSF